MSNKPDKNKSKENKKAKADVYVDDETITLEDTKGNDVEEVINEEAVSENTIESASAQENDEVNEAINNIVEEYNGDIKEIKEEKQIKVREEASVTSVKRKSKKSIIIATSILLAFIIVFVSLAIINKMNPNIYRNVYINGQNLSGMTNSELTDYLKNKQKEIGQRSLTILQGEEEILKIVPSDISFEIDIAKVEEEVLGFGRNSNFIKNNIDVIVASIFKKEFNISYKYDVTKLTDTVKEIKESLTDKTIQDSFVVDEKEYKLIITRGKSGNSIEEEKVKNNIVSSLSKGVKEYKLETVVAKPDPIDVDVIYSKVKREAKDAYIDKTTSPYKFVPHEVGLDFDKTALQAVLAEEDNQVEEKVIEYKLTVVEPKVKTSDIKWELYEYQISSYTTRFSTVDANRVNNLRVALNLINGKVIMPGETFSYNAVVGGATAAQGFKPAATFVGGRVTSEVGGGICQTVSTLYNTALLANLEIVQRKAHSLPVAYVPGSRDATVYYPSIDFKFKNTREYPIKIVTSFNSKGSLTISLYGTKQENEYVVSISSKTTQTIPYTTQYVNDSTLEKGKQVVSQNGSNGYKSEAYITKKLNGKVVSTTLLSKDTYKAVTRIVRVGTKVTTTAKPSTSVNINTNTTNNSNATNSATTNNTTTNTNTGTNASTNTNTANTTNSSANQ